MQFAKHIFVSSFHWPLSCVLNLLYAIGYVLCGRYKEWDAGQYYSVSHRWLPWQSICQIISHCQDILPLHGDCHADNQCDLRLNAACTVQYDVSWALKLYAHQFALISSDDVQSYVRIRHCISIASLRPIHLSILHPPVVVGRALLSSLHRSNAVQTRDRGRFYGAERFNEKHTTNYGVSRI